MPGTPSDPLLGRHLLGRYRVESLVARGGMAGVYRASDELLQRPVAVKVLAPAYAGDEAFVARFLEEARAAAGFSHPNLVHVYDVGTDEGVHFIVLELLDGYQSLRARVREDGPLPVPQAVDVVLQVLSGLEPLHAGGLVHCDVKSGNVMVGPDDVKLIDFGIARPQRQPSRESTSIGSLHAMSPEQLRGDPLTPASDIFAVGVVLFEALTGRVPFPGERSEEVAAAHRRGPVARPSHLRPEVPARIDDVVMQALRPDPRQRFASADAMEVALRSAWRPSVQSRTDSTTVSVPVVSVPQLRRSRLRTVVLAAAAVPVVVLALLLANGLGEPGEAVQPSVTATPQATRTVAPGTVRVPATVGLSEAEAEAAARAAGLNWRIEWHVDQGHSPGIYDQEPAAGTVVEAGSRFVMYAYRNR